MIRINELNKDVIVSLRFARGASDADDPSHDGEIAKMTAFQVFDGYMGLHRMVGYSLRIWRNIENIKAAEQK